MTTTLKLQKRSIDDPTEVREFDKGRIDIVTLGDTTVARSVFQPGWTWRDSVKPLAGTDSCEFRHLFFIESGSLHVRMDDGEEMELVAGDVAAIEPGHDAWVTSPVPLVALDLGDEDEDYGKPAT